MNKLSIIICTYNRSKILCNCIKSLIRNNPNLEDYEIVVIDNNSKDKTKKNTYEMMSSYKNIRYFFESNQGLSIARNRGIHEAKYELLSFLDDDVIVGENYVNEVIKLFSRFNIVCGGGKIYSIWNIEKPKWFKNGFFSVIGETQYGEYPRFLKKGEYVFGGNMFFKKFIFEKVGLFNENLGLKGNNLILGEEQELCTQIVKLGYKLYYLPEAKVGHIVHKEKINKEYVLNRWKSEGKSIAIYMNNMDKKHKIYEIAKRRLILMIRDNPLYFFSKCFNQYDNFFYKCKKERSEEILNNLKI